MDISPALIAKYNKPIPRYTSYPPANFFQPDFSSERYESLIKASNSTDPQNISIYIHIPFCKKICFYCGCNAMVSRDLNIYEQYVNAVCKEIEMVKAHLEPGRKVSQIHYGGGTPNAIPVELLQKINQLLFDTFLFVDKPEIAIECNPAYLDETYMSALLDAKFNRFSLGIQDFDKRVLDTVNRDSTVMPIGDIMAFLRKSCDVRINLDFIYGLPYQTVDSFAKSIEEAVSLSPDRIVTFSYAHVPWVKAHQKKLEEYGLPEADQKSLMFNKAFDIITKAGYVAIGFDHYAKPDDELAKALKAKVLHRNFQGYCTLETTGQVYAFGVSSISQLAGGFAQTTKNLKEYINHISDDRFAIKVGYELNAEELVIKTVIEEVMCNGYLNWSALSDKLGYPAEELKAIVGYTPENMNEFVSDGLLVDDGNDVLEVTSIGKFFIRNIAASLDPLLKKSDKKFSKSV